MTRARFVSDTDGPSAQAFSQAGRRTPWRQPGRVGDVLEHWRQDPRVWSNVTLCERLAARAPEYTPLPPALARSVGDALRSRGVERLYLHQAEAFALASGGRDIVVATPTASGKSLCYNLPVLQAFAGAGEARALYLFPTKALSRDQEQALRSLMTDAGLSHGAITYDGDTPGDARRAARERSGVLLTNPDMLHAGILPHHTQWARLFANLRYVVVDELHMYRGVFGSHLANVLRRLDRIARFHGSSPVYLFASATIGNPREHASRMLGRDVALVARSGAPSGARSVVVYNPPVVHAELGIRASYVKTAVRLTADLVRAEVPTLVFGQSRNSVEVMLKYLRERLRREKMDPEQVQAYRGGYLPDTRRRIETGLRDGSIRCVVATSALELGIDIGSLDAVVCAGYPGSMAGLWQRFGRGGRRMEDSMALLVTSSAPMDQFIARDARQLVGAPIEHARIDPDNVEILLQHLKCGTFELPFVEGEGFGTVPGASVDEALGYLADHRLVHATTGTSGRRAFHWVSDAYPANHVSLRSTGWDNVVVIDVAQDRVIAEMDWRSSHTMLHEQAIYQHEGDQYQVERLDLENHKAFVRQVDSDYFTEAMTHTVVTVLEEDERSEPSATYGGGAFGVGLGIGVGRGDVSVVEKVVGYKKIKYFTHENVGYGDVRLPEMQMHTTALWMTVPEAVVQAQPVSRPEVIDALRGFGHALHTVAALGLMVDRRDLGQALGDRGPDGSLSTDSRQALRFDPTLFLYDHVAGGIGLAPRLYDEREALLFRSRRLIDACECEVGCPACIGPVIGSSDVPGGGTSAGYVSRKRVLLALLDMLGIGQAH